MSGCLRSIGCLTLVICLAVGGWLARDRWLPLLPGAPAPSVVNFEPVVDARRARARAVVESLGRRSGPVFANLTAAEAAALVLADAGRRLPAFVGSVEAAIVDDRLVLRSTIDPAEFKGIDALGPLAALAQSRQRVTLAGTLAIAEPGHAIFEVVDVRINDVSIPSPAIAALVRQLDRGRAASADPSRAIEFDVPAHIGDVRVSKGRITLYKNVQ